MATGIVSMPAFVTLILIALGAPSAWSQCTPIVIDVDANGIDLGPRGVGVHFDVDNDGRPDHVQWVRQGGDESFLFVDRNGNGIADNGGELFGIGTSLMDGARALNGFVALAQYDLPQLGGNDDGLITSADGVWSQLRLWRDIDADGKSKLAEVLPPDSYGLTAFQTIPKYIRRIDDAGNILPLWARAKRIAKPSRRVLDDVLFAVLQDQVSTVCVNMLDHNRAA